MILVYDQVSGIGHKFNTTSSLSIASDVCCFKTFMLFGLQVSPNPENSGFEVIFETLVLLRYEMFKVNAMIFKLRPGGLSLF